jgi:tungstate transport system substrate-binding protein
MLTRRCVIAVTASVVLGASSFAQDKSIVVASTTSTQDSGLFGHILPLFKAKTGIDVKVVAQGTGQALDTGRRGDADVVLVHAKSAEEKFLAEGFGVKRYPVTSLEPAPQLQIPVGTRHCRESDHGDSRRKSSDREC